MGDSATTAANPVCLNGLAADLWPRTAQLEADGDISVGGLRLSALAARYGTPAYILDEADVRARCRTYAGAFPGAEIAYAGKAFLCRAMAEWIAQEGLSLDVCSAGELAVARSVSFPADRILLHGNAKTPHDLQAAVDYGVGRVVIDSASEIVRLAALSRRRQQVLIRVTPGIDAQAHPAVATGMEDQKFGFSLASGAAADAVRKVLAHPELELVGLHCHLGSQLTQTQAYELATARLVRLMAAVRNRYGLALAELNLGGGHAVPYVAGDEPFSLARLRGPDPPRDQGRVHRAPAAASAAHRGARPGDREPGDGHALPRPGRQARPRRPGLCGGGRRHERQPEAGSVRCPVHSAGSAPARRGPRARDSGRAALRGRGYPRGGRAAAGRHAGPGISWPCPVPVPTTTPWRPTTTWSVARP